MIQLYGQHNVINGPKLQMAMMMQCVFQMEILNHLLFLEADHKVGAFSAQEAELDW